MVTFLFFVVLALVVILLLGAIHMEHNLGFQTLSLLLIVLIVGGVYFFFF
jgi:hypothetical protein